MSYVTVEIEMDVIDTTDLIDELMHRKYLSKSEKSKLLKVAMKQIGLNLVIKNAAEISLIDKMKWQTISEHIEKKTLEEIEAFFV